MKKKILVSPLNWGLGHASRCIPIIRALIDQNFLPVMASDGDALLLLQKEFPKLTAYQLPSYNIVYSKNKHLKYKLLLSVPKIINAVNHEKKVVKEIIFKENISGIISDNRFGIRHSKIPSVYITHQLKVLSGKSTYITSKLHRHLIAKFDECWIPDNINEANLTGELSNSNFKNSRIKFIGTISRFEKKLLKKKYELLIILSGPEPQRTILEQKLSYQLKAYNRKTLLVKGIFSNKKVPFINKNVTTVNFMLASQLERAINQSEIILARSGYSTIMDLSKLNKKAFFIPTPGQFEQEYLARRIKDLYIAPFALQENFELKRLDDVKNYNGFQETKNNELNLSVFNIFR